MDKIKDEVSDEISIIAASGETKIGSAGEQPIRDSLCDEKVRCQTHVSQKVSCV